MLNKFGESPLRQEEREEIGDIVNKKAKVYPKP